MKNSTPTSTHTPPKKLGRPSIYTDELAEKLCYKIAHGKSMVAAIKEPDTKVGYDAVCRWLADKSKPFCEMYMRAKQAQADYLAEEVLDIAADQSLDSETRRHMIDARKWYAAKVAPRRYGDRAEIAHTHELKPVGESDLEILARHKLIEALPAPAE